MSTDWILVTFNYFALLLFNMMTAATATNEMAAITATNSKGMGGGVIVVVGVVELVVSCCRVIEAFSTVL